MTALELYSRRCYNFPVRGGETVRRFYISEMDRRALTLAKKLNMGLETIDFCWPENMESESVVRVKLRQFEGLKPLSLHAPYYELFPCAIDPMIRDAAMHRFTQALEICRRVDCRRMVAHSGYAPQMYFPQWFVSKSISFWKEFAARLPDDFELMIENVLDTVPEHIRDVCDGVGDPRVRICLDVGHANAYSQVAVEEWIRVLGGRIGHVHLHNNAGERDEHASLDCGSMDVRAILEHLDRYAPEAAICIESMDAEACLRYLMRKGYIHEESI